MKLIAQVKLVLTNEQKDVMKRTFLEANGAANMISEVAWKESVFSQFSMHKLVYHTIRDTFNLSSQMVVRTISKVADSYKTSKTKRHVFNPLGGITYDERIMTWKAQQKLVSLWTVDGRLKFPYTSGERDLQRLENRQGEADIVFVGGEFYIFQTCNVDECAVVAPNGFLGVDMGIINTSVDSDGDVYQGNHVAGVRRKYHDIRKQLQSVGTKSAKKRLKLISGRESRFVKWVNHNISKKIVLKAKDTNRGIAVEDLSSIRYRKTANKAHRKSLHNWSFAQLREFITYKACLNGVLLVVVNPQNTSTTCPVCGNVSKLNRTTQADFKCVSCHHTGMADHIAAMNIAKKAEITRPIVSVIHDSVKNQGQG